MWHFYFISVTNQNDFMFYWEYCKFWCNKPMYFPGFSVYFFSNPTAFFLKMHFYGILASLIISFLTGEGENFSATVEIAAGKWNETILVCWSYSRWNSSFYWMHSGLFFSLKYCGIAQSFVFCFSGVYCNIVLLLHYYCNAFFFCREWNSWKIISVKSEPNRGS